MSSDRTDVEQARRAAQREAARKRQADFRARQRARGLEMVTLKVPAAMRGAFSRLAARLAADSSDDELEDAFDEIREAVAASRDRAPGADAEAPTPAEDVSIPEPEPHDAWVDLAGLWKSSDAVGTLSDFTVVMADLEGSIYTRWTAQQRRPAGIAAVDAYVRGTRSGPHDAVVTTGRMSIGGHDFEFRGVITAPERLEATLTEHSDGERAVHRAVFTRAT
jgi:hypothetical protein